MNIVQIYPGMVWGGAEQMIDELCDNLERKGHIVTRLTRPGSVAAHRSGIESFDFGPLMLGLKSQALAEKFAEVEADVVHIHDLSFIPVVTKAAKLSQRKIKIVMTRHIARASKVGWWQRRLFNRIDSIIFVSGLAQKLFLSKNGWIDSAKCNVIHNSVSTADRQGQQLPENLSDLTQPVILFCGRVRKSKGVEVLVKALSGLLDHQFTLVIAGKPRRKSYEKKLRDLIAETGMESRTVLTGHIDNPGALIHNCAIGVVPSIVREAGSISVLEFLSEGKPVVTTDNGSQPEYITDESIGTLVPPDDVESLRKALKILIESPELRHRIGENAKKHFNKELSYHVFLDKIIDVYSKAID